MNRTMSRRRAHRTLGIVLATVASAIALLIACSNQGEGERCEFDNGNQDCAFPLICLPSKKLPGGGRTVNSPYNNSDRCCPADPATATHPACTTPQNPIIGDSQPPTDTGPAPDTGSDTGTDAADAADASDDAADGDADAN